MRNNFGVYRNIFLLFQLEDHEAFNDTFHMNVQDFEYLCNLIKGRIEKKVKFRVPIEPEVRLALVIW